jgi:hypothetical protein
MITCSSISPKTQKQTGGKADPKLANQILIQKLNG